MRKLLYVLLSALIGLSIGVSSASAQSSASVSVNGIPNQNQANGAQILNAIPTPPPGAQLYANMQNASGWIACAQGCAGGGPGITSITQNVTSPLLAGTAMQVNVASQNAITGLTVNTGGSGYVVGDVITVVQSGASGGQATVAAVSSGAVTSLTISSSSPGTAYSVVTGLATTGGTGSGLTVNITSISAPANSLFYNKTLGCPTAVPGGCVANGVLHILEDYYIVVPTTDVGIQAIENDPDLYDGTYEYFDSRQCDSVSGMWRLWNMKNNNWITTAYACPLLGQKGVAHHIREYTTISRVTQLSTYKSLEVDGVTIYSNLDDSFPPQPLTGTAAMNFEVQLDLNAGAGAANQSFLVGSMNAWVW